MSNVLDSPGATRKSALINAQSSAASTTSQDGLTGGGGAGSDSAAWAARANAPASPGGTVAPEYERAMAMLEDAELRLREQQNKGASDVSFAAALGNVLEWYDFAVFGYFAEEFGSLFFPAENKTASLLGAFGVFAGAFFMRPVGGVLFGHVGDRTGRKKALTVSILLMALPTFLLGCLPTYATAGVWAPILLTLVRLLQGLSVGGQLVGSFVYIIESAPPHKRGLYGSVCMATASAGVLLGSAVGFLFHQIFSREQIIGGWWRAPFLAGIVVGYVGYHLQKKAKASPAFEQLRGGELAHLQRSVQQSPMRAALATREARRSVVLTTGAATLWCAGFYLCFVWMASFQTAVVPEGTCYQSHEGDRCLAAGDALPVGCPPLCVFPACKTGSGHDGRAVNAAGICRHYCSSGGYCGVSKAYSGGKHSVDCTVCPDSTFTDEACGGYFNVTRVDCAKAGGVWAQRRVARGFLLNTLVMCVLCLCFPLGGWLSDRLADRREDQHILGGGRRKLLAACACGMVLVPPFVLAWSAEGSFAGAFFAQLLFAGLMGVYGGVLPVTMVETFDTEVCYSSVGMGYNLAQAFFGGTAPLVATALAATSQGQARAVWYPGVWLALMAAVSLVALRKGHVLAKRRGDERATQYAYITEEFGGDAALFGGQSPRSSPRHSRADVANGHGGGANGDGGGGGGGGGGGATASKEVEMAQVDDMAII